MKSRRERLNANKTTQKDKMFLQNARDRQHKCRRKKKEKERQHAHKKAKEKEELAEKVQQHRKDIMEESEAAEKQYIMKLKKAEDSTKNEINLSPSYTFCALCFYVCQN